ncbi:MAG: aspartate--tRNA ligase [Thermotogota bacterium]|nr:aspartate--tRNA ligase [Thermotogota bacterium]
MKKRTHTCGDLTTKHCGREVVLSGWVDRIRDLGGIKFVMLRDRYGYTQIVFDPNESESYKRAQKIGAEYVINVTGVVRNRPEDAINPDMKTGYIEVLSEDMEILSTSETPPIYVNIDDNASEEMRLKYRYLDLRKPTLQKNLAIRHKAAQATRSILNDKDFLEIETPVLTKSTPEGARDFLVPSRIKPGKFYALPQSPQLFKQLLMISGVDRYYQIVKCYRDEDFRADRQPEFTQIDLEMSFVDRDDIIQLTEEIFNNIFKVVLKKDIQVPFDRMTYTEAIEKYGSDKPDRRYEMEITDVSDCFSNTNFRLVKDSLEKGDRVKGILIKNKADIFSRKRLDDLTRIAKENGLGGLLWVKVENELKSPVAKHCSEELKKVAAKLTTEENDVILIAVAENLLASKALGKIRENIIHEDCQKIDGFDLLWVLDFPMFTYNEEYERIEAEHHPFTMPYVEDIERFKDDPLKIRSHAYDLVVNGYEIASGSVRIHDSSLQQKVFDIIGMEKEIVNERFGFLLEAFKYGPPPHAGIAVGFDRLIMILSGSNSLRDVIAFPKTTTGSDLMTLAPSTVDDEQLKQLKIKLLKNDGDGKDEDSY